MKPTNQLGYVPGDYLVEHKEADDDTVDDCLGFVCNANPIENDQTVPAVPPDTPRMPSRSREPVMYVAIEDYLTTGDARQMSFSKGSLLEVVEKCEDG